MWSVVIGSRCVVVVHVACQHLLDVNEDDAAAGNGHFANVSRARHENKTVARENSHSVCFAIFSYKHFTCSAAVLLLRHKMIMMYYKST